MSVLTETGRSNTNPAKPVQNKLGYWLRWAFSFPAMLTTILITVVFIMARGGMNDPDIWWHMRNAEYLMKFHQLPLYDTYSFTVAGSPWINHEWLAEIPFYLAWRSWGLAGIKALVIAIVALIFLGLLYYCYKASGNIKASILACCFSIFLAVVSFGPRTILFGYVYLVVLLLILQRFRIQGRAPLWLIPPLFCLWANTHGSWSLGLIVFGICGAAGLVEGRWGRVESARWSPSQLRKLIATGLLSIAALFINPFGVRLVLYPFDLAFRQKLNIAHIAEWVSVNFHDVRGKTVLVLLLGLLISMLLRGIRYQLAEIGLLLFALYSGLTYIRFLFLLAMVAAPIVAKILDFLPSYDAASDQPLINALMMAVMVGAMVHYWPTSAELQRSVDQEYPTKALSYLSLHPPNSPMLNFYLWGGFLGWSDRNVKIFVDSRVDIFEYAGVFQDYLDLLGLKQPENLLQKYHINYVLFPPDEPLAYVLKHDSGWRIAYSDQVSVLFERIGVTAQ